MSNKRKNDIFTSSNDGERFNRVNNDQIAKANCGANGLNSSL